MLYFTLDESNSTASESVQNGLLNVYWIGLAILQAYSDAELHMSETKWINFYDLVYRNARVFR